MATLRSLKESAKKSCVWRGHKMTNFKRVKFFDTMTNEWFSYCKICDCEVYVKPNPQPNEINICGDAVAITCLGEE
jgi:hypothetical protein